MTAPPKPHARKPAHRALSISPKAKTKNSGAAKSPLRNTEEQTRAKPRRGPTAAPPCLLERALTLRLADGVSHLGAARAKRLGWTFSRISCGLVLQLRIDL